MESRGDSAVNKDISSELFAPVGVKLSVEDGDFSHSSDTTEFIILVLIWSFILSSFPRTSGYRNIGECNFIMFS